MERIKERLRTGQETTWIFYGGSSCQGAFHTHGWRDYGEIFEERVRFELHRPLDVMINNAFSGNTTRDLLSSFGRRIEQFKPDVVFLMVGLNDCNPEREVSLQEFETNLQELQRRIASWGGLMVVQTAQPIAPGGSPAREQTFDAYMDILRKVAKETNSPLIDHTDIWRRYAKQPAYWMSDALHPNQYGHLFFAHTLFRALGIFDPDTSAVCRHLVPARAGLNAELENLY